MVVKDTVICMGAGIFNYDIVSSKSGKEIENVMRKQFVDKVLYKE
jgi:hypothetical protein